MSQVTSITIKRACKINLGNYENTDIGVELSANVGEGESVNLTALALVNTTQALVNACDEILKAKIDAIELGERKAKSKAVRFGV